jgi:excisionase family DNA binding protein
MPAFGELPASPPDVSASAGTAQKRKRRKRRDPATYGAQDPALVGVVPRAVTVPTACKLLSCGVTHAYDLINKGELESYLDGKSRRVTLRSIDNYIARRVAAANKATPDTPPRRRRGRPRKDAVSVP